MRLFIISSCFVFIISACSSTNKTPLTTKHSPIPHACLVNTKNNYQFVTGLIGTGSGSYNDKRVFYSPIQSKSGYIKNDINDDGVQDYIFLERIPNKNNTRLVTCISQKIFSNTVNHQQYKRLPTPYLIREYRKPSLYIETTSVSYKNKILSINFSTHAHNDGGESETSEYVFNQPLNDFGLTKFEYSAYGEVFPEISQTYDFKKLTYHEETGCSFANNPSAMGYNPSCKPHSVMRCLKKEKIQTIRARIDKNKIADEITGC